MMKRKSLADINRVWKRQEGYSFVHNKTVLLCLGFVIIKILHAESGAFKCQFLTNTCTIASSHKILNGQQIWICIACDTVFTTTVLQ